jgi:hypothetical protein
MRWMGRLGCVRRRCRTIPLIARLRASDVLSAKTTWSGFSPLMSVLMASRVRRRALAPSRLSA